MFIFTGVIFLLSGSLFEYIFYSIERFFITLYAKSNRKNVRYVTYTTDAIQFLKLPILLFGVFYSCMQITDLFTYVQLFIFFCLLTAGKYVVSEYFSVLTV